MRVEIQELRAVKKDFVRAPKEILVAYEVWARLVEGHGTMILKQFKGYHDEKLGGQWTGFHSCRLNRKWRVIYSVQRAGDMEIVVVARVTPHDYRRSR